MWIGLKIKTCSLGPNMITLVPYHPEWTNLFAIEKERLRHLLKDIIVTIDHIGSTAIPGIYAKPVIDILIGIKDLNKFTDHHIALIESIGYQYIKSYEKDLPYRRFFQKDNDQGQRTHQIHLVNYPSAWWQRHILFRDYLREYSAEAKAYETLKLKLAKKFEDTNQYAMAKTKFCNALNEQAYFDFKLHKPLVTTSRLRGYIPQLVCLRLYQSMFQDADFINCFGIKLTNAQILKVLERDTTYWDKYQFGPLVWFDKKHQFIGEGGLNHTFVNGKEEIELTYSLKKDFWGNNFAVEIGHHAINYGFQTLNLPNIVCFTMINNYQSLRVIEKLGFQYEKDFTNFDLPHRLFRLKK